MHLNSLQDKHMTMAELEKSFGSNTCRCTGYRPILDTIKSFAVDASPELCQRVKDIEDLKICSKTQKICERKCSTKTDNSDWIIVNDLVKATDDKVKALNFGKNHFFKVYHEQEIFDILNKNGVDSYMLIDGNTGKGIVEVFEYPRVLIDISDVKSLKTYSFDQNLILGANISLEDCIKLFRDTAKTNSDFNYLSQFANHFELIAHVPVRKLGSLAGNMMFKHAMPAYQSDVFILFEAIGAMVTIRNSQGRRTTISLTDFLKRNMQGLLIVNFELPPLNNSYIFNSYKIMPRSQNALAIVNAGYLIKWNYKTKTIDHASIVYGNISPDFVHATRTENYLRGKNIFNNQTLQDTIRVLSDELVPKENPPQPSSGCRKKLAIGLFYKFILSISPAGVTSPRLRSGATLIERPVSRGSQDFQTDSSLYPLNQPVQKLEALIQSAGEAQYANDTPWLPREVFGAFVLSTIHVGEIDHIDTTEVLKIEGVLAVYTAKDIPGKNTFTVPGIQLQIVEEEIIASSNVKFYGQPVAIVVAHTEELAASVARKVKVTYKNVSSSPPVLTIDQAKKDSKRYVAGDASIESKGKGDNVKKVIKGIYEIESQYHYYMETMTCVVVPVDKGLEVYNSTQWMDLTQIAIATCLDMKESDVHLMVRRIGGGFGGKISRSSQVATACALVAKKQGVPCRFILPLQTNLTITGKRLPCQCEYEVGVDNDGKIQYLTATILEDNGSSNNEDILSYTIEGFKNCYNTDYFSVKTANLLTDLPSNTFARSPGTCEGMASIEHIMEHIAFEIKKDATAVRLANMRKDDNDLPSLIEDFKKDTDYDKRVKEIEQYNQANRWKKRAIKINIMGFPVVYYGNYSAMVSIYRGDGTVTVSTGGVEMGQGLNTKAAQVCAYELGIPLEYISVIPNYSFVAANNVFSGSSITSESVCYSIIKACATLKERLKDVKEKMTNPTWRELVKKAGDEQVDLTATYMMKDTEEDLKPYTAFAVAILEVELDVLTGRYEMRRADILEDVGLSANPSVDVGQVEGGYIQGIGYFTTEKLVFDKDTGKLLTNRSLNYHVPLALDIPIDFRVKLRYNSKNPNGVLSSKAVGEMGLCTAHGITHALRQCILESRKDSGYATEQWINIDIPYDTESILKALDVKLGEFIVTE
uniref:Aldehyde oxidase 8 n=1 Tax=Streltzoviella insularis TaxID=1206366 RepID=A0A7D5UMR5_9NEOP|nr:aldehyde oxidase 8 [Streltzoviella insularis]